MRIIEKLDELEKLIVVPNIDKHPDESLKAMEMLNLIVQIRGMVKDLEGNPITEYVKCDVCGCHPSLIIKTSLGTYGAMYRLGLRSPELSIYNNLKNENEC